MKLTWAQPNYYRGWVAKQGILEFEIYRIVDGEFRTELQFGYGISLDTGTRYGGSIQRVAVAQKMARSLKEAKENATVLYDRFLKELP